MLKHYNTFLLSEHEERKVSSFKFQVRLQLLCLLHYRLLFLCLVSCVLSLSSFSQKVSSALSRDKIRIGETFELKLTIEPTGNNKLLIDNWFVIPDTFNHFEVIKRLPIDTLEVGSVQSFSQKIILTSFDTGTYQLPVFYVTTVEKKQWASQAFPVTILPVNLGNMKDYHDIKDIIEVEPETDWKMMVEIAVGVLILLALLFFAWKYLSKKKPIKSINKKALNIDEVLQQIDALQPLLSSHQYKIFFTQLIALCRSFSDTQLHIASLTKTTDEYMVVLKGKVGNEPTQVQYFQLLRLADAVKFAKFIPLESDCLQGLEAAKTFVKTIHSFNYQPKSNAV